MTSTLLDSHVASKRHTVHAPRRFLWMLPVLMLTSLLAPLAVAPVVSAAPAGVVEALSLIHISEPTRPY